MTEPTGFKDHFSRHAAAYAAARPVYPEAMFDFLAQTCAATELVWDAGCGNGQAARALARHFARVYATDASADQIAQAGGGDGLEFHHEPVEHCGLEDGVADLVTAAQAAHWFDLPAFYQEVGRVLKPGGTLALWCYGANRVNETIDPLVDHLRYELLGPYWPPERALVEAGYATLPFPFPRLPVPAFDMRVSWSVDRFLAYLRSWSSSQRYLRRHDCDPVAAIEPELRTAWGTGAREVVWPLALLAARVTQSAVRADPRSDAASGR